MEQSQHLVGSLTSQPACHSYLFCSYWPWGERKQAAAQIYFLARCLEVFLLLSPLPGLTRMRKGCCACPYSPLQRSSVCLGGMVVILISKCEESCSDGGLTTSLHCILQSSFTNNIHLSDSYVSFSIGS